MSKYLQIAFFFQVLVNKISLYDLTFSYKDTDSPNQTATEFLLLGFSGKSEQEEVVFGMFLGMYLVTISGNLLIVLAISWNPHLHTPMYFFLANSSSIDMSAPSFIVPKALVNHLLGSKSISYGVYDPDLFLHHIHQHGWLPPECDGL